MGMITLVRIWSFLPPAPHLRKQPQYLDIEPDQRDHESECSVPLHKLRRALRRAALDEIEVEHEVQGRDDDDEEAEADPDHPALVNKRHADAEEAKQDRDEIDGRDPARCRDHAELEILRGFDHPRLIREQETEERAEGEPHGLDHDARVTAFEDRRNPAEHQPFEEGVERGRHRGPRFLKDRNKGDDEAAERPADDPRRQRISRGVIEPPCPGRTQQYEQQQQPGFIRSALDRHGIARSDCPPVAGKGAAVQRRICSSHHVWVSFQRGHSSGLCSCHVLLWTSTSADSTFRTIRCSGFRHAHRATSFLRLEYDAHPGMKNPGYAPQGAEGVSFVGGRFKPADLLLRYLEEFREFLLGKSRLLAEGGDLERHVPGLARAFKSGCKRRIFQLLFEIPVEVGLVHRFTLFSQSRIRTRAVSMSRSGIALPLLRIECTATIRRFFTKNQSTRVLSLPTWRNSNKPLSSAVDNGSRWYWRFRSRSE